MDNEGNNWDANNWRDEPPRVHVRSSAELLNRGLIFNAYANWAVAIAILVQNFLLAFYLGFVGL